jgi:hypothetical protein
MIKIEGSGSASGSGSGSTPKCHGFATLVTTVNGYRSRYGARDNYTRFGSGNGGEVDE